MQFNTHTHHLLNPNFLERPEPTRPRLHMQPPLASIRRTPLTRTIRQRRKTLGRNLLENLVAARITRVRVDEEEGLDFRDTGDDASDGD
jgi:hypothetical protein